uniref:Uncharacterized protein n=1 Tax=Siphoviridae sp. ctXZx16 TaxID=2826371 RepID=A0A8S5MKI4_9CAUD|nr:MAG TPA: hypothetical protein [Siphoviridae sp. ctXZx16]
MRKKKFNIHNNYIKGGLTPPFCYVKGVKNR